MQWVLVFFLAANPQDYRPHTGYVQQANCEVAQARYSKIFAENGNKMQAECRRVQDVQLRRSTQIVVKNYTFY